MQENASEWQLRLIRWQIFFTVTWRDSQLGTVASRRGQLWDWLYHVTLWRTLVAFRAVPIVVRWEKGEQGLRPHAHGVIAGLIPKFVTVSGCFQSMSRWEKEYGFARVRMIERDGSYLTSPEMYLLKESRATKTAGADRYEFRKFGGADSVEVNDAAWRAMLRLSGGARYVPQA